MNDADLVLTSGHFLALEQVERIMSKTLHSLSQEEDTTDSTSALSTTDESTAAETSDATVKSMSETARRLMQLKLIKRQPSIITNQQRPTDSIGSTPALNLNLFLQALLDRSVQQISHCLGTSANWSLLAPPSQPLTQSQLVELYDSSGRIQNMQQLQLYVFRHGLHPDARPQVWKHLLEIYPAEATWTERTELDETHHTLYEQMRSEWQNNFRDYKVQQVYQQIKKDVLRTDRTHPFFATIAQCHCVVNATNEPEGSSCNDCMNALQRLSGNSLTLANVLVTYSLNHRDGYWQGMSDLCAALLLALKDETATYVCFCALMERVAGHFTAQPTLLCDQLTALKELLQHFDPELFAHLQAQQAEHLLFAYRWLLLQLKREFPLDSALNVLEVTWASQPRAELFTPTLLHDELYVANPDGQRVDGSSNEFPECSQEAASDLDSTSGISSDPFESTCDSRQFVRVWPDQMRQVMRSLYGNIESALHPNASGKQSRSIGSSSLLDGVSSGLGSCSSLTSTMNQSMPDCDEPSFEPSIELCEQLTLNQPTGPLFPLAFLNTFSGTVKNTIRPRRSIRFLPKILSNDSAEAIDSPDAEPNSISKFAFPPKLIDKQTSVDSLDSLELGASCLTALGRGLSRQSNSFDEHRKLIQSGSLTHSESTQSPSTATTSVKLSATRTNSNGFTRRSLNPRAPPPLRLTGMASIRAQRSLPNSPLLKKKQDSFDKLFGHTATTCSSNISSSSGTSSGVSSVNTKVTNSIRDDLTGSAVWKRRAPERCESLDAADQLVHCSGDQPETTNRSNDSDSFNLSMSSSVAQNVNTWAPEIGLLDSRFSSFDAESVSTCSPSSSVINATGMMRTSLDWRLRSNAFDRNVSTIRAASFASNQWVSNRADAQRQPSIGSLSSDSSHSCDECEHDGRCSSRRRSSTDDFAMDSIVLVCGASSQVPELTESFTSALAPWPTSIDSKHDLVDRVRPNAEVIGDAEVMSANTKESKNLISLNPFLAELQSKNTFLLFTCLTLLLLHRESLLRKRLDANEISIYFDRLVRRHDAQQVLSISRQLFLNYLRGCQNIQKSLQA